jgi:hypothetical protein
MIARRPLILEPAPLASTSWCATASKAGYVTLPGPPGAGGCQYPFTYAGTAPVNLSLMLTVDDCSVWPTTLYCTVGGVNATLSSTGTGGSACSGFTSPFNYYGTTSVSRSGVVTPACAPSATGMVPITVSFQKTSTCQPMIVITYAFVDCNAGGGVGHVPDCHFCDGVPTQFTQQSTMASFVNSPLHATFTMDNQYTPPPGPAPDCRLQVPPFLTGTAVITQ